MKKLQVQGETVLHLPEECEEHATIAACETPEQFSSWGQSGGMACRYEGRVYVKVPQQLVVDGEFSLNYDCLPLEEANERIEQWNEQAQRFAGYMHA